MPPFVPPQLDRQTLAKFQERAAAIYAQIEVLSRNPDANNIRLNHIFSAPTLRSRSVSYQNEEAAFATMIEAEQYLRNASPHAVSKIIGDWRRLITDYATAYAALLTETGLQPEQRREALASNRNKEIHNRRDSKRKRQAFNDAVTRDAIEENFRTHTPPEIVEEMDQRGETIYGALVMLAETNFPRIPLENIFSENERTRERVRFLPDSQRAADSMLRVFGRIREAFGPTPPPQLEAVLENWRTLTEDFKGAMKAIRTGANR